MSATAIHQCDGYKTDHRRQYPKNTIKIVTNFTPRKSRVAGMNHVINYGITGFIKEFLLEDFNRTFFQVDKATVLRKYERRMKNYLPGNTMTYEHIEALHDLGYLPIEIKSLPEGALVKCGIPIMTLSNTLSEFFWLPNFLESVLSCELWQMSTSATTAYQYRLVFDKYAMLTVGNTDFSSTVQAHDFSMRGQGSRQGAGKSGSAHLLSFVGTDTISAIDYLEDYYNANSDNEVVGITVPATEHSVMCMGMKESERETFKRLINETYPSGFVSIVSDTWDFWNVVRPVTGILAQLHSDVMARDGRVVVRPDSGDPVKIITGYKVNQFGFYYDLKSTPIESIRANGDDAFILNGEVYSLEGNKLSPEEVKGAIECLWEEFGGTTTEKGYKLLDTHIGLIYGDSITIERAEQICQRLMDKGFASINWVAGVGSYTYQYVTRDTYGWAMKATYGELAHDVSSVSVSEDGSTYAICEDGYMDGKFELVGPNTELASDSGVQELDTIIQVIEEREIFKDPITDDGTKKSAKGRLRVDVDSNGEYILKDQVSEEEAEGGELKTVFLDGKIVIDPTLAEIRERVSNNIKRTLNL